MELPAYNLEVIISDPNDPETHVKISLERVPREKLMSTPIPIAGTLKVFEEAVED